MSRSGEWVSVFFRSSWNGVNMKSALQNLEGNAPSSRRGYRSSGNVWVIGAETLGDVITQVTVEKGYIQAPNHVLCCPAPSNTQLRQFNTNWPLIHVPSFLSCVLGSLLYQPKWPAKFIFRSHCLNLSKKHFHVTALYSLRLTLEALHDEYSRIFISHQQCRHPFYTTECFLCKFCRVDQ